MSAEFYRSVCWDIDVSGRNRIRLLPVFRLQRTQGIGVAESRQLAFGYELLLHDRLLFVLGALLHEPFDRLVVPVLVGAEVDHHVFRIQALLTLGVRCIELPDPGLAIVFDGRRLRSGVARNVRVPSDLLGGEARGSCNGERDNRSANKDGLGHLWFEPALKDRGDKGLSSRVALWFKCHCYRRLIPEWLSGGYCCDLNPCCLVGDEWLVRQREAGPR